jgi:hypothetical protein
MKKRQLKDLMDNLGTPYSELLEIDLSGNSEEDIFKWFLASVLFGAPITESAAIKTYHCFEKYETLTLKKILDTGWEGLVKILDEGDYTRYDFKTADKLLLVMRNLHENYSGSLNRVHAQAVSPRDLEVRLRKLGKGIGDVTVGIFLRELRGIWKKADPNPTPLVVQAAEWCGIVKRSEHAARALTQLEDYWGAHKISGYSYVNFETALLRLGKDYVRKGKKPTFL